MRFALLGPALLTMLACATVPPEEVPAEPDAAGSCSTEDLSALAGRAASSELGVEAMRLSGARRLRWIRPGDAVTMDYRADRLNIHLDGQNRVERFACG